MRKGKGAFSSSWSSYTPDRTYIRAVGLPNREHTRAASSTYLLFEESLNTENSEMPLFSSTGMKYNSSCVFLFPLWLDGLSRQSVCRSVTGRTRSDFRLLVGGFADTIDRLVCCRSTRTRVDSSIFDYGHA